MDSQPSVQGGLEGMVLSSPEFRFDKGGMAKPPCGTPMSQASTVPNTPMMGWTLPDPAHFSFSRQHSMDSCVSSGEMFLPPWQRVESLHEDEEDLVDEDGMRWEVTRGMGIPTKTSLTEEEAEHKAALLGGRFQTLSRAHHGMLWRQYRPRPAPEMTSLEKQLAEVKALFQQETGQDVDDEDESDLVDDDGMQWVVTRGTGIPAKTSETEEVVEHKAAPSGGRFQTLSRSHHKVLERQYLQLPAPEMSSLEKQLAEVKALFKQKTGQDVNDEDEDDDLVDEDGTQWMKTAATGQRSAGGKFQTLSRSHHKALEREYLQLPAPEMSSLEKQLAEVKALFKQKTGQDVDDKDEADDLVDEDGMRWTVTRGTGVPAKCSKTEEEVEQKSAPAGGHFQTLSCSHHKALERQYLQLPAPEMSDLWKQLSEVKALFYQKTGQDVDDDSEDLVDEDGMRWEVTRGTGQRSAGGRFQTLSRSHHKALERQYLQLPAPAMSSLEKQLSEVKALFKQKTGEDVDDEDEENLVDEDGIRWVVTRGTHVPMKLSVTEEVVEHKSAPSGGRFQTLSRSHHKMLERQYRPRPVPEVSALEAQLSEVKALFKQKTGQDVDEVERGCVLTFLAGWRKILFGTPTRRRAPEMSCLEAQLEEVKALFKQKYGRDVDDLDESDLIDEDGMRWNVTRGTGVPSKCSMTEEEVEQKAALSGGRFQTLKRSHHKKLAWEYALQSQDMVDEDGMVWVKTVGNGVPAKTSATEEEVEQRPTSSGGKFQTFSRRHQKRLERRYNAQAPPELAAMEATLAELKELFQQKTGHDVDED